MVTLKHGCAVPATRTPRPLSCGFGADLGKAVSPPWPRTCPGTQGGDAGGPSTLVTLA